MTILLTADIHLDSNPENEYRWELLPWVEKQCTKHEIKTVIILGDLTTAKNRHDAVLVNRFVDQLKALSAHARILILKGNHDFIDPDYPFFEFLSSLSLKNIILFIADPERVALDTFKCAFLPAVKNPPEDWKTEFDDFTDFKGYDYIFTHQTYKGILTDKGFPLPGVDPAIFGDTDAKIWSGDIHMPIKIKGTNIEYIGAPYRTNYGDTYIPRVVLIDDSGCPSNLFFPCPTKILLNIKQLADLKDPPEKMRKGDYVKIRVHLSRSDYPEWHELKQEIIEYAEDQKWILHGQPELVQLIENQSRQTTEGHTAYQSPKELASDYAKRHDLSKETEQVGLNILNEII